MTHRLYHGSKSGIAGPNGSGKSTFACVLSFALLACLSPALLADSVDVTVRRAPHLVSTNKYKLESNWEPCRYCGSKTNYERKYEWDVYKQVWVDITKKEDIPDVCRKCRKKLKDREKLDRRERDLDRQIDYQETKIRIDRKKSRLENLRRKAR